MFTESKLETAARPDEPTGQVHDLLHDSAYAAALGRMPDRRIGTQKTELTNDSEHIVDKASQAQHERVGNEFSRPGAAPRPGRF